MAAPVDVENVKLFVAVLFHDPALLPETLRLLEDEWGPIDFRGPDRPFDMTDYYEGEMGANLQRRLVSFEKLVPPENLRQAKLRTNAIEDALALESRRVVNLDIGYLDHNKVVLGSVKYAGQKIHLGDGIYADMIARYRAGRYHPFEWTFPDFRDGRYDEELGEIRRALLRQRKQNCQ